MALIAANSFRGVLNRKGVYYSSKNKTVRFFVAMKGCMLIGLLFALSLLSACSSKQAASYLVDFQTLTNTALIQPETKTDKEWKLITREHDKLRKQRFVAVHAHLSPTELAQVDSLDNIIYETILKYTTR